MGFSSLVQSLNYNSKRATHLSTTAILIGVTITTVSALDEGECYYCLLLSIHRHCYFDRLWYYVLRLKGLDSLEHLLS